CRGVPVARDRRRTADALGFRRLAEYGFPRRTSPIAGGPLMLAAFDRETWQPSAEEVHPRQALSGFQLAPDGRQLVFVLQRDLRAEQRVQDGRRRIRTTPLADLCRLPATSGYPRPLTTSRDAGGPPVWSPDGRRRAFQRRGA